jgi:hypothetical protein
MSEELTLDEGEKKLLGVLRGDPLIKKAVYRYCIALSGVEIPIGL